MASDESRLAHVTRVHIVTLGLIVLLVVVSAGDCVLFDLAVLVGGEVRVRGLLVELHVADRIVAIPSLRGFAGLYLLGLPAKPLLDLFYVVLLGFVLAIGFPRVREVLEDMGDDLGEDELDLVQVFADVVESLLLEVEHDLGDHILLDAHLAVLVAGHIHRSHLAEAGVEGPAEFDDGHLLQSGRLLELRDARLLAQAVGEVLYEVDQQLEEVQDGHHKSFIRDFLEVDEQLQQLVARIIDVLGQDLKEGRLVGFVQREFKQIVRDHQERGADLHEGVLYLVLEVQDCVAAEEVLHVFGLRVVVVENVLECGVLHLVVGVGLGDLGRLAVVEALAWTLAVGRVQVGQCIHLLTLLVQDPVQFLQIYHLE
eukprot:CAMPEP_0116968160 /NCGR_PEP_ID=MMETSP0467-20121206/51030_1 /TAXON_ID=283647 /ORGANISM="Mesodinium pulex, Strain SPMC105" /LENGTH=368 /DNA_ID=CAMNT_0004658305 /DNA_START=117 /DNA_END=1223 /DNA_ORIENTATION=+